MILFLYFSYQCLQIAAAQQFPTSFPTFPIKQTILDPSVNFDTFSRNDQLGDEYENEGTVSNLYLMTYVIGGLAAFIVVGGVSYKYMIAPPAQSTGTSTEQENALSAFQEPVQGRSAF